MSFALYLLNQLAQKGVKSPKILWTAMKGMTMEKTKEDALRVFQSLYGDSFAPLIEKYRTEKNVDENDLYSVFLNLDPDHKTAIDIAFQCFLSTHADVRQRVLSLFGYLFEKNIGVREAIAFASRGMDDPNIARTT